MGLCEIVPCLNQGSTEQREVENGMEELNKGVGGDAHTQELFPEDPANEREITRARNRTQNTEETMQSALTMEGSMC